LTDNPIGGVLGVLRLLKNGNPGHSVATHIRLWISGEAAANPTTESQVARLCGYVLDEADAAEAVIKQSSLSQEAQEGLLQTTQALRDAFTISNINNGLSSYFPALGAAVSNFAILTSATGLASAGPPPEIEALIAEVEALHARLDFAGIDPVVSETARKHLAALTMLLRNVDAFGVDAAMAAYAELLIRLKRAASTTDQKTASKVAALWPEIERWAGRLAIIDQAYNSGKALLGHLGEVAALLPHLGAAVGVR
jgi:hypothetical protein